jgi:hypothetical protein
VGHWNRASGRSAFAIARRSCGFDSPYMPSGVPRFADMLWSPLTFAAGLVG